MKKTYIAPKTIETNVKVDNLLISFGSQALDDAAKADAKSWLDDEEW